MIAGLIGIAIIACAVLWLGWAAYKYFRPGPETSQVGRTVEKVVDKTQDWAFMAALRGMLLTDEVRNSPACVSAVAVLMQAFGADATSDMLPDEPKPGTTSTIPAAVAAAQDASEIHWSKP